MAGWLGPLIGAAGSILGGALGGSEKQKGRSRSNSHTRNVSVTSTRGRVEDMVRAAERNGFNPLTFLRAGGLASFTNSATRGESWSNTFSKTRGSSQSSSPLGAGIAQAATIMGNAVSDNSNDTRASGAAGAWQAPSAQASMDNVNRQLANVQSQAVGTQPRHSSRQVKEAKPELPVDGSPIKGSIETPTVTNPFGKNSGILVNPDIPDAEMFETRYGDQPVNAGGGWVMWEDLKYNVSKSYLAELARQHQKSDPNFFNMGNRVGMAVTKGLSNVWDPIAIKMYDNPVVKSGSDVPLAINHYKKPEFVDGGPKW